MRRLCLVFLFALVAIAAGQDDASAEGDGAAGDGAAAAPAGPSLAERKATAITQIQTLSVMLKDTTANQSAAEKQNLQLQSDLSSASFSVAQLQLEISALERSRAGLMAAMRMLEKEDRKLQERAFAASNEARQAAQDRAALATKQSMVEKRIEELEAARKASLARIKVQNGEIERLGKELLKAQTDLATATKAYKDRDEDLTALVSAADSQRSTLLAEVKELLKRKEELSKKAEELADKLVALQAEKKQLTEEVEAAKKEVDSLQAELKAQTTAADATEKALDAAKAEERAAEQKVAALSSQRRELELSIYEAGNEQHRLAERAKELVGIIASLKDQQGSLMAQSSILAQRLHTMADKLSETRKTHLEAVKKQKEAKAAVEAVRNRTLPVEKARKEADAATIDTLYQASKVRASLYALKRSLPAMQKKADRLERVKAKQRHFGSGHSRSSPEDIDDERDRAVPAKVLALVDPDFAHTNGDKNDEEQVAADKAAKEAIKALADLKGQIKGDKGKGGKGSKKPSSSHGNSNSIGGRFMQIMEGAPGVDLEEELLIAMAPDASAPAAAAAPPAAAGAAAAGAAAAGADASPMPSPVPEPSLEEAQVEALNRKAATIQTSIRSAQASLQNAKTAIALTTEGLAQQREKSSSLGDDKLKGAESVLALKTQYDKEKDRIAAMRVTFDNSSLALTKAKDAIVTARFDVEQLQAHLVALQHRTEATQQEEERMETTARAMEGEIEKVEESRSETVVALKTSITEKVQRRRLLAKDIAAQTSAKSLLGQQVEFLQRSVQSSAAQITSLEHIISGLKSDQESLKRKKASLLIDIEHATSRLEHAKTDLPAAIKQRDEMNVEARALEKAVAALQASLAAALAEVKTAAKGIEALAADRKAVNAAIGQLKLKNAADEQSSFDLTDEIASLLTGIEEAEGDARSNVLKREQLEKKLEDLKPVYERATTRLHKAQKNLAELKASALKYKEAAKMLLEELGYIGGKTSKKQQHEDARFRQEVDSEAAAEAAAEAKERSEREAQEERQTAAELSGEAEAVVEADEVASLS